MQIKTTSHRNAEVILLIGDNWYICLLKCCPYIPEPTSWKYFKKNTAVQNILQKVEKVDCMNSKSDAL